MGKAIAYILATPERPDDADNTLKSAFGTEASVRDRDRFRKRFGCYLIEGYGQSEGGAAINPVLGMPKGALGKPVDAVDLAVISPETGEECPPAQFDAEGRLLNAGEAIGEIVNRSGPGKFEGYYQREDAEAERLRRGWYWTGDLGYVDADGFFYFAGRTGDWLRVDSENFAAGPVEAVLSRHPDLSVVAVYPVPDTASGAGDQVMLALETVPGRPFDPEAFAEWLAAQPDLGPKWVPRYVRVSASLPQTATGKVTKVGLRAEAWACDDPVWWRPLGTAGDPVRAAGATRTGPRWRRGWPRTAGRPWAPSPRGRGSRGRRSAPRRGGPRARGAARSARGARPPATRGRRSCPHAAVHARRAPRSPRRRRPHGGRPRATGRTGRRCRGAACAPRPAPR